MATRPLSPTPPPAPKSQRFTRASSPRRMTAEASEKRSNRRRGSASRPSGDLAGRSVAISIDVPAVFDVPLAPHHKAIGRWVAEQGSTDRQYTRNEARQEIESTFNAAVMELLKGIDIAEFRVAVLNATDDQPPAIAVLCESIGQVELGWIEKSNVLSNALKGPVAPLGWRASAYQLICDTLGYVLPVISYEDMIEELSMYYWDGATSDKEAIDNLVSYHGHDLDDLDETTLPSAVRARRPDWMIAENAGPLKKMPKGLRDRFAAVRKAHVEFMDAREAGCAWCFNSELIHEYFPEYEDRSFLAPMTIVCADSFARELDDICRVGMEMGFMDVAGLLPLAEVTSVDRWFASFKAGIDLLRTTQDLISTDPTKL